MFDKKKDIKKKVMEERKEISMFDIMKHMLSDDMLGKLSKMALKEFMKEKKKQKKKGDKKC